MGKPHRSSYIIITFHFSACHFSLSLSFCWPKNLFFFFFSWETPFPINDDWRSLSDYHAQGLQKLFQFLTSALCLSNQVGFQPMLLYILSLESLAALKILWSKLFNLHKNLVWSMFPFQSRVLGDLFSLSCRDQGQRDKNTSLSLQYIFEAIWTLSTLTSAVSSSGGRRAKTLQKSLKVYLKLEGLAFEGKTNTGYLSGYRIWF